MSNLINCITCNNPLIKVFYECTSSDYRIIDEDNNLLFIKMEHDLPNDSDEIGTKIATRCPFLGPTPLIQINTEIIKYKHKDVVKNAELYLSFL